MQEDYQIFTAGHIRYQKTFIFIYDHSLSPYEHTSYTPSSNKPFTNKTSNLWVDFSLLSVPGPSLIDSAYIYTYIRIYVYMNVYAVLRCIRKIYRSINNQINIRKSQVVEMDKYVCTKTAFNPFISFKSKSSWLTGQ